MHKVTVIEGGGSYAMTAPEIIWETEALMYCSPMPWTIMDNMFRVPGHASIRSSFHEVFLLHGTGSFRPSSYRTKPDTDQALMNKL